MSNPPKAPPSLADIVAKKQGNAPAAKTVAVSSKPAPSLASIVAAGPQPKKKKKNDSILGQIGHVIEQTAMLPVTLPSMAAHAVVGAGRFGYDYLNPTAKQSLGTQAEINQKYFPEATGLVNSGVGTYTRVANLIPAPRTFGEATGQDVGMHLPTGWKQNAAYYQKKIDEGGIVGAGVEDLGNIAMAASLGSSAIGSTASWTAPITASERAGVAGLEGGEVSGAAQRASTGIGPLEGGEVLQRQLVPGKGLAGYLERTGETPGLATNGQFLDPVTSPATQVGKLGSGLHQISAGADPLFRPLNAAGDILEAGANKAGLGDISAFRPKNFVPKYGGEALQYAVDNTKLGKATLSGLTTAGRALSRELGSVRDTYQGDLLGATRQAMDPAMMAKNRFGMTDAQASAAMTIDNLFQPLMDTIKDRPDAQAWLDGAPNPDIEGMINRPYAGVATEGQRPTPEMIRELMNYESGATAATDPHMAAAMDAVRQSQSTVSGARSRRNYGSGYVAGDEVQVGTREVKDPVTGEVTTEPVMSTQYTPDKVNPPGEEAGVVSPENYGNTLRPSVVLENQRLLQKVASKLGRQKESVYAEMLHEERVNRALQVVVDDLPAPPNVATERNVGKYTEREAAARREYKGAQKEVERAVDEYVKLSESETTPAAWAEAQRRLDAANARAEKIREHIVQTTRRQDATFALSRASGEFEPGARRTFDPDRVGLVSDVSEDVRQPEVDIAGQPTKETIRRAVKERQAQVEQGILDDLDRTSPEGRTIRSSPSMQTGKGGEHDFWEQVSVKDRRRLIGEKWFRKREGIGPDELMARIPEATSAQHAAEMYIDKIKQLWAVRDGKGDAFHADIAAEMGIPEHAVSAAMRGTLADYAGALKLEPGNVMADLRSDFEALDSENAQFVEAMVKSRLDDPSVTPTDLAGDLAELLPRNSVDDLQMLIDNNVDMRDLAKWILTGDETTSLRAIMDTRTSAQYQQLGRYAGELSGLKSALPGVEAEENAAISSLSKAAEAGGRAQAKSASTLAKAQGREEWYQRRADEAAGKIPTDASEVKNPWRRYESADGTVHASKAERQRDLLAASNERVRRVQREYQNVSRSYDRAQWKVGNVHVDLGQQFQERLVEGVNGPALNRADAAVGKGIKTFGEVKGLSGLGGGGKAVDPYVTGALGAMAGKYGVYDELLDSIHARMTSKASDMGLDMADKTVWTDPAVQLEPSELHAAFLDALEVNGKKMENWEATQLNDAMHSAQLRYNLRGLIESNQMVQRDRPGIVDTSGTGTAVPGGKDYTPRSNGQVWAGTGGKALQAPFAVFEHINDYLKDEWVNPPEDIKNAVNDAKRSYLDERDRFLHRKMDTQAKAIPAPFRGIHQVAKMHVADLLEQATKLNEAKPGTGDVYAEMAWDVASGLDEMVAAGLSPQHMIGGPEVDPTGTGSGGGSGFGGRRKAKAANLKTTGFRETGIEAYARVEAKDLRDFLLRRRDHVITTAFAKRIAEIPALQQHVDEAKSLGRDWSGPDITAEARKQGWVPLKPNEAITPEAQWIPKRVESSMKFDSFFDSDNPIALGFKGLHWVNSQWKQFLLGLSPKWVMGNVIGMTLAATVHAGLGPGEFLGAMRRNVAGQGGLREAWQNEGLLPELPGPLSSSGLTSGEYKIAYAKQVEDLNRARFDPRRATDAIKAVTYPGNEVFDNLSKSTVYLSKLADGMPREAALKSTLDAMGNYNNMSVFERRIVREIFPFYAWMKQSSKAMLRLPYVSPMRAAMVYSIGTAMMDPDLTPDVMQIIGSRFQLGAGNNTFFDMGSFNPNADFSGSALTAFDPRNLGQAASPGIRFGIKALTGVDPSTWGMQSRPNDTYNTELYGQKGATPSWSRLFTDPVGAVKETAWDLKNLTPLSKNLANLAYGNEARYAGTGYPIARLPKNPNITWPRSLLAAAQLPNLYTATAPQVRKYTANQVAKKAG